MAKQKIVTLGKNPKLSEMIEWAEQNGMTVQFRLIDKVPETKQSFTCMDCGKPVQLVRPGKYQCNNPDCSSNQ